jgi:hypothetical protein
MSHVVVPAPSGSPRAGTDADPVGKLATTLLSVTVAGMAEPGRFRRGRVYATQGAVVRLVLDPGIVRAEVLGSDPQPYDVEIRVPTVAVPPDMGPIPERGQVSRLIPDDDDIGTWCTCPDADSPCKHAVAALVCLATAFSTRPDLLVIWRCADQTTDQAADQTADPAAGRPVVTGNRARRRHLRSVPTDDARPSPDARSDQPSPFDTEEWQTYTGQHLPEPGDWAALLADQPAPVFGSLVVDRTDVGVMVRSLVDTVARAFGAYPR